MAVETERMRLARVLSVNMAGEQERPQLARVMSVKLERESSLPRIDINERPSSPTPRNFQTFSLQSIDGGSDTPLKPPAYSPPIPPNTKKLRMRSFLWVKPPDRKGFSSALWAQLLPVLAVNIGALSTGLAFGYSSIVLPQLRPEVSLDGLVGQVYNVSLSRYLPFTADSEQGSWIASIFGIGAIFGGLFSAVLGNKSGRRTCMLVLCLVDLLGWLLIAASRNLGTMLAGRFLSGFVAAGYAPCIQIYVAEITQAKNRGWMLGLTVPILCIGTLLMYTLGTSLPWHYAAASCTPVPVLLGLTLCFLCESPYWYFSKGEEKLAFAALDKFRGKSENCISESFMIQEHLREAPQQLTLVQGLKSIFSERKYYRPLFILNILFLFMIFSGKFAIEFYAVDIFAKIGGHMDNYISAVIIAIIQLAGALLFIPLVKRFSRKMLIVISSFIMGTSLLVLGLSAYCSWKDRVDLEWTPLVCVVLYMVAAPIGLCSVPFMYVAEFFPSEIRSILGGITISLVNLELFVVVKTFPSLELAIGDYSVFWIYAGACYLSIVFTLSYIPETKDKSLLQVPGKFDRLRKVNRASPWVSPMPSPSINSVRKLQFQTMMFTQ